MYFVAENNEKVWWDRNTAKMAENLISDCDQNFSIKIIKFILEERIGRFSPFKTLKRVFTRLYYFFCNSSCQKTSKIAKKTNFYFWPIFHILEPLCHYQKFFQSVFRRMTIVSKLQSVINVK